MSGSVELPFGLTEAALAAAMDEPDPDSLGAATRLRRRVGPEQAAAALQQAALRRRAAAKFGPDASTMFFTRAGLEQATRPAVADRHAARFVAAGVRRVVDLGCGIGSDARAFARAGLDVVAVEQDPDTAAVATANLAGVAEVVCADAESMAAGLLTPGVGAFADPARRNARGRLWRVTDFAPSWALVTGLLDGRRTAGVKLGPALPHELIGPAVEAEWVTDGGDTVEVALWAGAGTVLGRRSAVAGRRGDWAGLTTDPGTPELPVRGVGAYFFEPAGAVIRSGGIAQLGWSLGAGLVDPHLAYLTGDGEAHTPFATTFAVRERLAYDRKALRRWVVERGVGRLEIRQRGITGDPAELRRTLRPTGPNAATLVLSRTPGGAVALVVDRLAGPDSG